MEYFLISKSDKTCKCQKKINLKGGYSFNQRISISLYNEDMIRYILNKKVTNSLKNIINLYLLHEEDEDDDGREELLPKIELLRSLLIEKYYKHLSPNEIEAYLDKLNKIENKINSKQNKKRRTR